MNLKIALLLILEGAASAIGIVSAVGSTCPTLNPPPAGPLSIIADWQWLFYITTGVTYLVAFVSGFLAVALWARKQLFYNVALFTAILGFLSGIIPVVLVTLNGMSFTPSWFRTINNLIILIVLLIPSFKEAIADHVSGSGSTPSETKKSDVTGVAAVLLGYGIVLLVQPFIIPGTHVINGVNYYDFADLQLFAGLLCLILSNLLMVVKYFYQKAWFAHKIPQGL